MTAGSQFSIQLPGTPITAGDLIGKSVRMTRLHWRGLFKLYLPTCFINSISVSAAYWWATDYVEHLPAAVLLALIVCTAIVYIVSRIEIGVRSVAIQIVLTESIDFGAALSAARSHFLLICLVTLPMVLIDLIMIACVFSSMFIFERMDASAQDPIGFVGLAFLVAYLVLWMPATGAGLLNGFFSAILVNEKWALVPTLIRLLEYFTHFSGFLISYLVLGSGVYVAATVAFQSPASLSPASFFNGTAKFIAELIFSLLQVILLAPFCAGWYAAMAIGGSILAIYFRNIREGADLNAQLIKFSELRHVTQER